MAITIWIALVVVAAALKAATAPSPPAGLMQALGMTLPFLVLAAAPVAGYRLAGRMLADPRRYRQPSLRLARYGSWRSASDAELALAQSHKPGFAWASLAAGILLNVPVRALEFLLIVPAVSPANPPWAHAVVHAFTFDAAAMCFVYSACFVAALRQAPLFPRMLVGAWLLDVAMQGLIALYAGHHGLPSPLVEPMTAMLVTNVRKVAISAAIWLPYLLISDAVNLRCRRRIRVSQTILA
ncbi:DUF2569 domain-containing protein [Novosphingobium sp. KCTC 2891]|uniref:DUF2569 domain-containing protein n=1 Tax=Novosphingobium sp. KCTC 2891 TaxID=2989730 RepID=UPI0022236267|nr:DUF2569 domain-containing protein [Novosphingobium sp. KCTC 2891]MCW1381593.1 DUF2569 domain-containing protein [Novosphingobium sp. KCTC 2891]